MPSYTTSDIRNVVVAGHQASGKTTLTEALLFAAGAITSKGDVTKGTTVSDFEKEEKHHGHSIFSTLLHLDHVGRRINLIDTPGSPELSGTALSVMPAVETVMVVVNAHSGIEVVTRRVMEAARERNLPRVVVINMRDAHDPKQNQHLESLVNHIREMFGSECLPVNLPTGNGTAVIECLLNRTGKSDIMDVDSSHQAILDQVVEVDESLMEKYLGGDEPNFEALHDPFEKCMDEAHVIPILFVNAKTGVGVQELLDFMAQWLPSPLEGNQQPFMFDRVVQDHTEETPFEYKEGADSPMFAHVFKVCGDPFVGKLAVFRVHDGKLTGQSHVIIGSSKKPVKLGHVFQMQGKQHVEVPEVIAGDIGAVAKIDEIKLGDVLHDDHKLDTVHHKRDALPVPMYSLAVIPKARGDETKLIGMLTRMAEEDPTFVWHTDKTTHEVVITGMGELHLRFVLERLDARGLHVETKPPKIAYKETILGKAEGHYRHKKQTGGSGQFGEVHLRVEPLNEDDASHTAKGGPGFEFVNEVFGGTIPGQFIPAVEKGVRDVLEGGAVAGYPIQNVRCIVYDGKHHPVDSKEIAFRTAGKYAFMEAIKGAKPALLEPVVKVEVIVPDDKLGAITGDLSGKRGRIQSTDTMSGGYSRVTALAPLGELLTYNAQLKSATGGQGSFTMDFSHYDPAPAQVQQREAAGFKVVHEE
ncbi:MAG TPA: elongation factor G [Tepidisphaeraceae bacterium]|nr:elongation factor G [Tepidisphaeraceae bacterium]